MTLREDNTQALITLLQKAGTSQAGALALVDAGVDVTATASDGMGLLSLAAKRAMSDVVARLIAAGADVNHRDHCGKTPLMWATWNDSALSIIKLLNAGAEIDAQSDRGGTVLMEAAWRGQSNIVSVLLLRGADPTIAQYDEKNASYSTAADIALEGNHPDVADLIRAGVAAFAEKQKWLAAQKHIRQGLPLREKTTPVRKIAFRKAGP